MPALLAAVVTDENNEGIFPDSLAAYSIDDAPDPGIHMSDTGRVPYPGLILDLSFVHRRPFLRLIERKMGHTVSNVEEKRFIMVGLDHSNRFVGNQVGGVAFFIQVLVVSVPGAHAGLIVVRIRINLPVKITVGRIETVLTGGEFRRRSHVPFAAQAGLVSAASQRAG